MWMDGKAHQVKDVLISWVSKWETFSNTSITMLFNQKSHSKLPNWALFCCVLLKAPRLLTHAEDVQTYTKHRQSELGGDASVLI